MDSILFALAALCFAVCALRPKSGRQQAAAAGCGCALVCLALLAARERISAGLHVGDIAAAFALMAVAVLLAIDRRARFVRSWQIIPAIACVSALAALLPLPGHAPAEPSSLLWVAHALPAALSYACFAVALSQLADVHFARASLAAPDAGQGQQDGDRMPLLQMEAGAFRTFYFAFAVLTVTLASGIVINHTAAAPLLEFSHKHLFAILTWLASLVLVAGRLLWGWRGSTAFCWLAAAGAFLLLSYMGTVFVLDIVLGR